MKNSELEKDKLEWEQAERLVLQQIRNINRTMLDHAKWQGPEEFKRVKADVEAFRKEFKALHPEAKI